jgi:hypothetical protein
MPSDWPSIYCGLSREKDRRIDQCEKMVSAGSESIGGTATFEQPPGVDSLDAVSQAGRLAGTMTVNGVRRGWTSYHGSVTFLDLPNAQPDHFFRPVAVNSSGNDIIGVHHGPNGSVVGGVLFAKQVLSVFQDDTPPIAVA